jgi:hypothetical protein
MAYIIAYNRSFAAYFTHLRHFIISSSFLFIVLLRFTAQTQKSLRFNYFLLSFLSRSLSLGQQHRES